MFMEKGNFEAGFSVVLKLEFEAKKR